MTWFTPRYCYYRRAVIHSGVVVLFDSPVRSKYVVRSDMRTRIGNTGTLFREGSFG